MDKTIADYNAALSLNPRLGETLYRRGLAKNRKGDAAGGKADIAINFAGYGLFVWTDNSSWVQLHPLNVTNLQAGDIDQPAAALIRDLRQRGLLDETLIVMAGEFGRTPKIKSISATALPGRDHWGHVQSILLAGGGIQGGANRSDLAQQLRAVAIGVNHPADGFERTDLGT